METNSSASLENFCAIFHEEINVCLKATSAVVSITAYTITNITIQLPLCIYIIYLGFQRQRSGTPMKHSDFFTYHMVAVELVGILATLAIVCGIHTNLCFINLLGLVMFFFYNSGQTWINIFACVERYLAAVHPIIYLSLRKVKGNRIRNIAVSCAWLYSFGNTLFSVAQPRVAQIYFTCLSGCLIIIVSFFCVSVLCVLTVPGPGKGSGASGQIDQTKLKVFYVMMVVMGVLLLRFGGNIVTAALFFTLEVGLNERCFGYVSVTWSYLPSGVLLPLLFLHRAGKLACIKKDKETAQTRRCR